MPATGAGEGVDAWGDTLYLNAMETTPTTFQEILDYWPSLRALADDLEVGIYRVRKWRARNSIPPEHWTAVVTAARARALPVELVILARIAAARR